MTSNEESLSLILSAVADVELERGRLAELEAEVESTTKRIAKAEGEAQEIRNNTAELEKLKRAQKLRDLTALLEIERSDLVSAKARVESQKYRLISVGKNALTLSMQSWSAIYSKRKADAEEFIRQVFDTSRIPLTVSDLAQNHRGVREAKAIGDHFFSVQFGLPGMLVEFARCRERYETLAEIISSERGINLHLNSLRPEEPAVVESTDLQELALV